MTDHPAPEPAPFRRPGLVTLAAILALYVLAAVAATYPRVRHFATSLPNGVDPVQHLWIMRWYKTCLAEGRSPLICPDLQYPVGAPLSNFSPLHLESLLYLPLSLAIGNDILCYNLIWMAAFLLNGMGTFALALFAVGNLPCAVVAGLLGMLSGPMMLHAHAHLELIFVGTFPLFLLGWIRFVDRPTAGRTVAAAGLFTLLAMGAAYFTMQAVFPAALYAAWHWWQAGRGGRRTWLVERARPLAGFVGLTGLALAVLFSGQIWALLHGVPMGRPRSQFGTFVAPLWSYVAPTEFHASRALLPFDLYARAGYDFRLAESASYLGVVALVLLQAAALGRPRPARASFWWLCLALLVVLSMGPSVQVGARRVELPAAWLWKAFPILQMTRNPARFNLFAASIAAVLAAAGLRTVLVRVPARARAGLVAGLAALAVADLRVAYREVTPPALPAAYRVVTQGGRRPAVLEAPVVGTAFPTDLTAAATYWQSIHRARTTAGYSGNDNGRFDDLIFHASPFSSVRPGDPSAPGLMTDPEYLADPEALPIGPLGAVPFADYTWLFLRYHGFEYVLLHKWDPAVLGRPESARRLAELLAPARIFDDGMAAVFATDRLAPPTHPVLVCGAGWRHPRPWEGARPWHGRAVVALGREARIAVFNPDPAGPLTLTLEAAAFRKPRAVRLLSGGAEVARWTVEPADWATFASPPFRLPAGLSELTLVSDGEERVTRDREAAADGDRRPYSLRVAAVRLTREGVEAGRFARRDGATR